MPYVIPLTRQYLSDGLYLITQHDAEKGVEHSGILDVGNTSGLSRYGVEPIVIHLRPSGLHVQPLSETGAWTLVRRLADQRGAVARIAKVRANPTKYSLLANNCEHFTEHVENGVPKSRQVIRTVLFAAGAVGLIWGLSKLASKPKRVRRARA